MVYIYVHEHISKPRNIYNVTIHLLTVVTVVVTWEVESWDLYSV